MRTEQTASVTHLCTRRDGNLVLHRDVPVFRRRLHDRQADLQRRQTPAAAVQHGFTVYQRVVQLVEFRGVSASGLSERYFGRAGVTVDVDAGWRLPHLPMLARNDEEPEVTQKTRPVGRGCSSGRSSPLRIQRALIFRSSLVSHPGGDVLPSLNATLQSWGIGTAGAWLEQLRRHEVAIGAIDQRRNGTVFALE